ncbi:MAG: helix-turn-helix domain-containing protein [Armatimonadota bacterium]|nr:helix-turn-helix domain-containing protein [Armatimonadota bacterium]
MTNVIENPYQTPAVEIQADGRPATRQTMASLDYDLVTLAELSGRLGISLAWLKREAWAGRIPGLRAGKVSLFNPSAVRRALAERAATSTLARGKESQ